jgi:RNA polymerase sigma-70 factor (ECF subfamily)
MDTQLESVSSLGNSAADTDFETIYHVELPRVYNFFRYHFGDDQIAEDLTAETFEKAWRNRASYRKDLASFSTWLFTIARRLAADHFRKQRPIVQLEDAEKVSDPQTLEDVAQERAEFAYLYNLLTGLAERERELVALKYGAGLTNRTIAHITGISESNVSTILHRLTQRLRAQWEYGP